MTYQGGVGEEGSVAELIGQGDATVLTGGLSIPAHWTRPDKTQPMQLTTTDGSPVRMFPGSTWVELPDVSYPVTVVPAPADERAVGLRYSLPSHRRGCR